MKHDDRSRAQHHNAQDRQWLATLQQAFESALSEPATDNSRCPPTLRVLSASDSGTRIEIELRYRAGVRYCCAEWMCHFPVHRRSWWQNVRETLRAITDRDPPPMSVHVFGVVEHGALLTTMADIGMPIESRAYGYDTGVSRETDAR